MRKFITGLLVSLLCLLGLGLGLPSSMASTHSWTDLSHAIANPPARFEHALAYDASVGKIILFGGYGSNGRLNDTWAYDYGGSWTNLNPANPPPVRETHALAYDASVGKVILFGGWDVSSGPLNDTWAYDYATNSWTNRSPANPPPTRNAHALAYDASAGKVILFGGQYGGSGPLNDTWAYDYATNNWTNLNPANPPPVRSSHALAYDASAGKAILFGGWNDGALNDTWAYDYATNSWTNLNPANPPPVRDSHALAYDAAAGKVILFGGTNSVDFLNDTWALTIGEGPALILRFFIGDSTYFVNSIPKTMDTAPVIVESRTFFPIRYVAEELGAEVNWYPDESKVEILHKGNQLWLWLGQRLAGVNGELVPIDPDNPNVVPFIEPPGRTMMPLRFISENLGALAEWFPPDEARITYPAPEYEDLPYFP